jgi:peroxiredoxin
MTNLARTLSLAANAALALLLAGCGAWAWQSHRAAAGDAEGADGSRVQKTYEVFILDKLAALRLVGLTLPTLEFPGVSGASVSTDMARRKGGLVLLFKPQSCQACLITQLKGLQHVYAALLDTADLAVLAVAQTGPTELKRFTRAFGLTYPIASDPAGALLETELARTTPAVLLVNQANVIIDAHFPSPGKPEFSLLYYNELRVGQRLGVRMAGDRYDLALGGIPMLDVIRNDFGAPSEAAERLLF